MLAFLSTLASLLSLRLRGRAPPGTRARRPATSSDGAAAAAPGRLELFRADRILWIWLYRVWPRTLNVMVLVKPVVGWHRKGFRLYWRWRSGSLPKMSLEIRHLIAR
jgi:putative transposase